MAEGAADLRIVGDRNRTTDEGEQRRELGADEKGALAIQDWIGDETRLGQCPNKPISIRTELGIAGRKDQTTHVIGRRRSTLGAPWILDCHGLESPSRVRRSQYALSTTHAFAGQS